MNMQQYSDYNTILRQSVCSFYLLSLHTENVLAYQTSDGVGHRCFILGYLILFYFILLYAVKYFCD